MTMAASRAALAETLERIALDREKLVRGYVTGRIREQEYDALTKELEDEESGVREELEVVQHASARVRELEERREVLLRMFGAQASGSGSTSSRHTSGVGSTSSWA